MSRTRSGCLCTCRRGHAGHQGFSWLSKPNTLAVQWLGLGAFFAKGPGSIPGLGAKILQAMQSSQRKKRKRTISSTSSSPAQVATRHVPTASFCPLTACPSEPLCSPPLPWLVLDGVPDGQRAPPVN